MVIRMLTEMVEYGCKLEEKVKAMKMYREPTMKGRKPELKSMVWNRRKEETFNQNRMKKQEFKKVRRDLGNTRTSLNIPVSKS